MILLIDGYNVLKQVGPEKVSERERASFIKQLAKYAKNKGHKVVLVFDGGPFDWSSQERISGIYVVYSGVQETADDYIKRYLQDNRAYDVLLVSSDRELRSAGERLNIESLTARDFYTLLQQGLQKIGGQKGVRETKAVKLIAGENEELDAVMQEASKIVQHKAEDFMAESDGRKSKAHKMSKKERKRLKKIKKL